jgi:hypothetical protein
MHFHLFQLKKMQKLTIGEKTMMVGGAVTATVRSVMYAENKTEGGFM